MRQDSHPTRPFPHGALSSVLNGRNFFRMSERDGKATGGGRNRLKCALLYCNVHSKQFARSPFQKSHYPHCQIHQALTPFILSSISGFLGTNKATKTLIACCRLPFSPISFVGVARRSYFRRRVSMRRNWERRSWPKLEERRREDVLMNARQRWQKSWHRGHSMEDFKDSHLSVHGS